MSEKSKVLVVDDKQVERVMMKRILSGTYEVIEAENGKEAFEILYERSTEITAVLLDIVMPGIIFWNGIIKRRCIRRYLSLYLRWRLTLRQRLNAWAWEHGILSGNRMMWMLSGSG